MLTWGLKQPQDDKSVFNARKSFLTDDELAPGPHSTASARHGGMQWSEQFLAVCKEILCSSAKRLDGSKITVKIVSTCFNMHQSLAT